MDSSIVITSMGAKAPQELTSIDPQTGMLDSLTNRYMVRKLGIIIQEMMGPMEGKKQEDSSAAIRDVLHILSTPIKVIETIVRLLGLIAAPMLLLKNTQMPGYKDSVAHFYEREFVQIGLKEVLDVAGIVGYVIAALTNTVSYIAHSVSEQSEEDPKVITPPPVSVEPQDATPKTPAPIAQPVLATATVSSVSMSPVASSSSDPKDDAMAQMLKELQAQREMMERVAKMAMTVALAAQTKPVNITVAAPQMMAAPMMVPAAAASTESVAASPAKPQPPKPPVRPQPPKPPVAVPVREEGDLNEIKADDNPMIAELKAALNKRNKKATTGTTAGDLAKSAPAASGALALTVTTDPVALTASAVVA